MMPFDGDSIAGNPELVFSITKIGYDYNPIEIPTGGFDGIVYDIT
jgi:hypothetical protein